MLLSSRAPLPPTSVLFRTRQQSTWLLTSRRLRSTAVVSLQRRDPLHGSAASGTFRHLNKGVRGYFLGWERSIT